jgi:hypothetical protein
VAPYLDAELSARAAQLVSRNKELKHEAVPRSIPELHRGPIRPLVGAERCRIGDPTALKGYATAGTFAGDIRGVGNERTLC